MERIDIEKEICHGISPELAIALGKKEGSVQLGTMIKVVAIRDVEKSLGFQEYFDNDID